MEHNKKQQVKDFLNLKSWCNNGKNRKMKQNRKICFTQKK